jgi:hypothetical protein
LPPQVNWRGIVDATNALVVAAGGTTSLNQPASFHGFIDRLNAYSVRLGSTANHTNKSDSWETVISILRGCITLGGGTARAYDYSLSGCVRALSDLLITNGGTVSTFYFDSFASVLDLLTRLASFPTANLLLDTYSGTQAAFGLRKLRRSYSGNCVRVRRSSDNTEQDIGFVLEALDTASLLSFVGANSGFVVTWYDQSGNARNLNQSTAGLQPRIVNAGVLETRNTRPSLFFNNGRMQTSAYQVVSSAFDVYALAQVTSDGGFNALVTKTESNSPSPFDLYSSTFFAGRFSPFSAQSITLSTGFVSASGFALWRYGATQGGSLSAHYNNNANGSAASTSFITDNGSFLTIGSRNDFATSLIGYVSEAFYYSSELSSTNRNNLSTAINSYYSIW